MRRSHYVDTSAKSGGIAKTASLYRENGLAGFLYSAAAKMFFRLNNAVRYRYYRLFKHGAFVFDGRTFDYFFHPYNRTWMNERAIEVPIIMEAVRKFEAGRILEVGNVLSHYFAFDHDILDKYEKAPSVLNADIMEYEPSIKYDLIVSISTLEHAGYDEAPKDREKIISAVERLRGMLAEGGMMVVALPLGYNPAMDEDIKAGRLRFARQWCLKRVSRDNRWQETGLDEVGSIRYDTPYISANGLFVGIDVKRQGCL